MLCRRERQFRVRIVNEVQTKYSAKYHNIFSDHRTRSPPTPRRVLYEGLIAIVDTISNECGSPGLIPGRLVIHLVTALIRRVGSTELAAHPSFDWVGLEDLFWAGDFDLVTTSRSLSTSVNDHRGLESTAWSSEAAGVDLRTSIRTWIEALTEMKVPATSCLKILPLQFHFVLLYGPDGRQDFHVGIEVAI